MRCIIQKFVPGKINLWIGVTEAICSGLRSVKGDVFSPLQVPLSIHYQVILHVVSNEMNSFSSDQ